ncbi:MAG: hypothetical protein HUU55_12185 [Myxococcales bacterium]|nr:hypothetical protein [Myxococcales bacterium]
MNQRQDHTPGCTKRTQIADRSLCLGFCIGIVALCTTAGLPPMAAGAVPGPIPYVGELTLADGTPVDTPIDLEVSLYASANGGALLWGPFNFPGTKVIAGVFSILLGDIDTDPLDDALVATDELWIEFAINGVILTPRSRLYSVPYARLAGDAISLGGVGAAEYLQFADVGAAALSNDYNDLDNLPLSIQAGQCPSGQKVSGITAAGAIQCVNDANSGGTVTSVGATGVLSSTGGATPSISLSGVVGTSNGGTGMASSGAAGNFLRSDGSTWTSAALAAADLPTNSAAYVQNQTGVTQSGGFKLSGEGTLGGNLTVSGGTLSLTNGTSNVISFTSIGVGAPSSTSAGWKIRTWPNLYGIGIDSATQWYSTATYHRFYTATGSTWTQQMQLDNTGLLTVAGAVQPSVGNASTKGIYFPANPGGGGGDEAYLRYYVTSNENTRLVLAVENDADDELVFRVAGADRITIHGDEIRLGAKLIQTSCPSGFALRNNGVCTRFQSNWGAQTWNSAQETCAALGAHICTYADVLLGFEAGNNCSIDSRNNDWLGDFVADDTVLIVNDYCNKSNFEGTLAKNSSREFVCCIDPRR